MRAKAGLSLICAALIAAFTAASLIFDAGGTVGRSIPPKAGGGASSSVIGLIRRRVQLGRSVRGRRIEAVELGNPRARRTMLIVGCIHGDETAGIAIAHR